MLVKVEQTSHLQTFRCVVEVEGARTLDQPPDEI